MTAEIDPRFDWGQRVVAVRNLFNDGSYPEEPADALLVHEGALGEIVQVGKYVATGTIVYMVEFEPDKVIGCFESELAPWESTGAPR